MFKKKGRYAQILANRGAFTYGENHNIVIKGLEIRCGFLDLSQPAGSPAPGLRGQISFVRVRNVIVSGFTCTEFGLRGSEQYCLQFVGFDGVTVEDFDIRGGKDGIHFNYGRNFVVRRGRLETKDDGIALNAGDWPGGCTPLMGSIEHGVVEDVEYLPGAASNFARCIAGAWVDWHKGMYLQRNDLVRVGRNIYCIWPMPRLRKRDSAVEQGVEYESHFAPTHTNGVWKSPDGICFQFLQHDGNVRADIRDVVFRRLLIRAQGRIACGWEIGEWARLIHPDLPEKFFPVIDIRVEDSVKTTSGALVAGSANTRVELVNCRVLPGGPLVDFSGRHARVVQNYTPSYDVRVDGGPWRHFDGPFTVPSPLLPRVPVECHPRLGVGNVIDKIRAGEEVRVAYFGGSITQMNGWRRFSQEALARRYPLAKFVEIPAAIGGTGSTLGAYRFGRDVVEKRPDLVFVEFATNDFRLAPEKIWENLDGVLRQLWHTSPRTDVVFVYTVSNDALPDYLANRCPRAVSAMEQIAEHYGIATVDFGPAVSAGVASGRLVMDAGEIATAVPKDSADRNRLIAEELSQRGKVLFSTDGCHPAELGHRLYTDILMRAWAEMAKIPAYDHSNMMAMPYCSSKMEQAKIVPIEKEMCVGDGWRELPQDDPSQQQFGQFLGKICMTPKPGDRLCFAFRGSVCKLYGLLGPDVARLKVSVDGKSVGAPRGFFDSFCTYYRIGTFPVYDGVNGLHRVEIEVDSIQPDRAIVLQRNPQVDIGDPKFDGTKLFVAQLLLVGEIVK